MTTKKLPKHTAENGPGLRIQPRDRPWYGPGYCGVCGQRSTSCTYSPLVPVPVRWWDPDDGWRFGVLCQGCAEDASARGPRPGDYAWRDPTDNEKGRDPRDYPPHPATQAAKLDTLAELGDDDAAYSGQGEP